MSSETDRLEREAEKRRANVDATIDALRERLTLNSIVNEATNLVRQGNGAEFGRNLGRQVRDNPLALGIIGAGIAWLFAGPGVRDASGQLRRNYDDWRYDRFEDAFPPDGPASRHDPRHAYGAPSSRGYDERFVGYTGPAGGRGTGGDGHEGPGLGDRARAAASSAGSSLSGAASSVSDAAATARDRVTGAASAAGERVSDAAQSAYDAANRAGHDLSDAAWRAEQAAARGLRQAGDGLAYAGRRARRTFLDTLAEEPLVVGAVALAIGAAIGAALPSTRREDELFGQARDRLRDEALNYGRDALGKAEAVAERTYRAASEEADAQGLKPTGEGETLASRVGNVARAAVSTAKEEAKHEFAGSSDKDSDRTSGAGDTRSEGDTRDTARTSAA